MKIKNRSYLWLFLIAFVTVFAFSMIDLMAQGSNSLGLLGSAAALGQQRPLHVMMPLIIPLVIALLKQHLTQLPPAFLPILAPLLSMGANHGLQLGLDDTLAAVYGLAGVGVREIKDQSSDFFRNLLASLTKPNAGSPIAPGAATPKAGFVRLVVLLALFTVATAASVMLLGSGCALNPIQKSTTVTPGGTDSAGVVFAPITNTTYTVDQALLGTEMTALELTETPFLTMELQQHPEIRPVLVDIQTALVGWTSAGGVDSGIVAKIDALVGANTDAIKAQVLPLIQASKNLQAALVQKYGSKAGVIIAQALLTKDLHVINNALMAVPVPAPAKSAFINNIDTPTAELHLNRSDSTAAVARSVRWPLPGAVQLDSKLASLKPVVLENQ